MKNTLALFLGSFLLLFFSACGDDEEISPQVDANGLTREITDLVPQYILDEMEALGMPINGGESPPNVEGTYYANPFVLLNSNRSNDVVGQNFAPYTVTFSNQNNNKLTVKVDYVNGPESGNGIGSFIVGTSTQFSVFVEVNSQHSRGSSAKFTQVISGEMTDQGIENLHVANFMIDNYGNPDGVWIEDGEGRV
ncbi:MAG: hypothetical protein WBH03_02170, partial [Cyclobacteriaceae bacterium]